MEIALFRQAAVLGDWDHMTKVVGRTVTLTWAKDDEGL